MADKGRPANLNLPVKSSGIYRFLNKLNGKMYIGSAVNLYQRRIDHIKDLRASRHRNDYFQKAWNKYWEINFEFQILELVEDKTKLLEREQFWIDKFKSYEEEFGYNLNPIAGSNLGRKFSEEFCKKARARQLGKMRSEETKLRMSKSHSNRKRDPSIGIKISLAKKGKGIGRKHPSEQLAKMKIAQAKRRQKQLEELWAPILTKMVF